MTEKQFTFHISEYDEVVITKENDGREFFIGNEDDINIDYIIGLVDLLNEQHETIQQLKAEIKQLNHDLDLYEENNTNEILNKLRIELTSRMNDCIEEFKE